MGVFISSIYPGYPIIKRYGSDNVLFLRPGETGDTVQIGISLSYPRLLQEGCYYDYSRGETLADCISAFVGEINGEESQLILFNARNGRYVCIRRNDVEGQNTTVKLYTISGTEIYYLVLSDKTEILQDGRAVRLWKGIKFESGEVSMFVSVPLSSASVVKVQGDVQIGDLIFSNSAV